MLPEHFGFFEEPKMMVSQEVNFCHFERSEKSLNYSGDFPLFAKPSHITPEKEQ
jgi:hypothetical protein